MKWVRAQDGAIFGVCKGMARALDLSVGTVRLMWLFLVLFFGVGIGLYLMLAIALPREDKVLQAMDPFLLGVCTRIARKTDLDVGVVRFITLCLLFPSMGATLVGYVVLYFVLDDVPGNTLQSSDKSPSTPRSTT